MTPIAVPCPWCGTGPGKPCVRPGHRNREGRHSAVALGAFHQARTTMWLKSTERDENGVGYPVTPETPVQGADGETRGPNDGSGGVWS